MPVGAAPDEAVTGTFVSEETLFPPKTTVAPHSALERLPPVVGEMTAGGGESPLAVFDVGSDGVPAVPVGVVVPPAVVPVVVPPTTTLIVPLPLVPLDSVVAAPALVSLGGVVVAVVVSPPVVVVGGGVTDAPCVESVTGGTVVPVVLPVPVPVLPPPAVGSGWVTGGTVVSVGGSTIGCAGSFAGLGGGVVVV